MNRLLSIPLLLATCGLCFFAGYKLGKESLPPAAITSEAIAEEAPIQQLTDTVELPQVTVELPTAESARNPMEVRSQETVQIFFDKNGRELVAVIVEVHQNSLKIRRQADGQEMNLPVNMLSPEDQAFAAYLWEHQPTKSSVAPSKSMEDTIWDELFQ
jgi:hypothetical protein